MAALFHSPDPQEVGPSPLVRAGAGLLLGAAAGAVAALLTPRRLPDRLEPVTDQVTRST